MSVCVRVCRCVCACVYVGVCVCACVCVFSRNCHYTYLENKMTHTDLKDKVKTINNKYDIMSQILYPDTQLRCRFAKVHCPNHGVTCM